VLLRKARCGEELVEPLRDLCVAARTNRAAQDRCHEPIPRLVSLAGCAVHRSEKVIGHGYRGFAERHRYSSW
jgi:hypothetical protein